jgi:V-type H+-transporting ATPase subunit a
LIDFDKGNSEDNENAPSKLYTYKIFLDKERTVYQLLNRTNVFATNFIGYFWAPLDEEENIKKTIEKETAARIEPYDKHSIPEPTYFQVPEPLEPWYTLIDTYGIPSYGEANPAVVSIVWFPFLFGMMFGDLGHGSILLLVAIYFCVAADSLREGTLGLITGGRYLFLLMGIFATYCGGIYNEFFAIPLNTFKSCYSLDQKKQWLPYLEEESEEVSGQWVYTRAGPDCTYIFGYDPAWGLTSNNLSFSNNIKMKLSVIFGVLHMLHGIITKGGNAIYFR